MTLDGITSWAGITTAIRPSELTGQYPAAHRRVFRFHRINQSLIQPARISASAPGRKPATTSQHRRGERWGAVRSHQAGRSCLPHEPAGITLRRAVRWPKETLRRSLLAVLAIEQIPDRLASFCVHFSLRLPLFRRQMLIVGLPVCFGGAALGAAIREPWLIRLQLELFPANDASFDRKSHSSYFIESV